jgi:hypothetical protein
MRTMHGMAAIAILSAGAVAPVAFTESAAAATTAKPRLARRPSAPAPHVSRFGGSDSGPATPIVQRDTCRSHR